jgi:hypothetical protein
VNLTVASHVSALRAFIPHACALRLLGARLEKVVWRSEPEFWLRFPAGEASVALSSQETHFCYNLMG